MGVRSLSVSGPLLGVVPGATFAATRARLAPGESLVLFSDGVTEAENAVGDELGPDGLDGVLIGATGGADDLLSRIVQAADSLGRRHRRGRRPDVGRRPPHALISLP